MNYFKKLIYEQGLLNVILWPIFWLSSTFAIIKSHELYSTLNLINDMTSPPSIDFVINEMALPRIKVIIIFIVIAVFSSIISIVEYRKRLKKKTDYIDSLDE